MRNLHCYQGKVIRKQMLVEALVAPAGWWGDPATKNPFITPITVTALIDTGTNITCVPPILTEDLKVRPERTGAVVTAGSESFKRIYEVDIRILLPQPKSEVGARGDVLSRDFYGVEVMEAPVDRERIIIGMDIIILGKLVVEGQDFTLCL